MICITEITTIIIIFILFIIFFILFNNKQTQTVEYEKKLNLLQEMIDITQHNINTIKIKKNSQVNQESQQILETPSQQIKQDHVNETINNNIVLDHQNIALQNQSILQQNIQNQMPFIPPTNNLDPRIPINNLDPRNPINNFDPRISLNNFDPRIPFNNFNTRIPLLDPVQVRDNKVLKDPLYPPLSRPERPIFDMLVDSQQRGLFNYPSRGSPDTFRLMGYLINKDEIKDIGNNTWKLFGRQKYPGSSIGEFYAIPADDRKSDIKIKIKEDMMTGDKIRDIYSLPRYVKLKGLAFNDTTYEIIELDKSDLMSGYL